MDKRLPHNYTTLAAESPAIYTDKGSRFVAVAFPATSIEIVHQRLELLRAEHKNARHFCFGSVIGSRQPQHRSGDDGEPSGTAGKPILNQLLSAGVRDAAVIVVRYFGGVLLGTSGLINAYKEAARLALDAAEKKEIPFTMVWKLTASYAVYPLVMNQLKKSGFSFMQAGANEATVTFHVTVPDSGTSAFETMFTGHEAEAAGTSITIL